MSVNDQEYQEMKAKAMRVSKTLIGIGIVIFAIGVGIFIWGMTEFGDFDLGPTPIFKMAGGGFAFVIGFGMATIGFQIRLAANAGKISRYFAKATGGSMKYTTEQVTDGFATGLENHGMGIGGLGGMGSGENVIKVKCRNCGFLETEDAEFCSKCGERI